MIEHFVTKIDGLPFRVYTLDGHTVGRSPAFGHATLPTSFCLPDRLIELCEAKRIPTEVHDGCTFVATRALEQAQRRQPHSG